MASKSVSQVGEQISLFPEAANENVPAKVVVAAPAAFDYLAAGFSEIEICSARDVVRRFLGHQCAAGVEIYEMGTLLISAKATFAHGCFTGWVKSELGMSQSTANRYMGVARLDRKIVTVTILPAAVLFALAAPSTPETVRSEIIAAAVAGDPLEGKAVKRRIDEAKATRAPRQTTRPVPEQIEDGAPAAAVAFLKQHLGGKYNEFRAMVRDRQPHEFWRLLQE